MVQDLWIRRMKLVSQVQPSLQNLTRIVLGNERTGVKARGTEFAELRIPVCEYIEGIST